MALRKYRAIGRVQGVGFRAGVRERARALAIRGWAKNCADGSVEIVMEGDSDTLDSIAEWLANGPGMARVDTLRAESTSRITVPDQFEIR